jgi:hypothetical protein
MIKYRITKYNPIFRDRDGRYTKSEWTSYSDIGKYYDDQRLEITDYLAIEQKYIDALFFILQEKKISSLKVIKLEKRRTLDQIEKFMQSKNLSISDNGKSIFSSIQNGDLIDVNNIPCLIQLLLRECLWCRLMSPSNSLTVEFGYDYYMYVICDGMNVELTNKIQDTDMFIETMKI